MATRLLAELEAAEEEMRAFATAERGRLHRELLVGGLRLVPEVLTNLFRDRPQVHVRHVEANPHVTLPARVDGQLDLRGLRVPDSAANWPKKIWSPRSSRRSRCTS